MVGAAFEFLLREASHWPDFMFMTALTLLGFSRSDIEVERDGECLKTGTRSGCNKEVARQ